MYDLFCSQCTMAHFGEKKLELTVITTSPSIENCRMLLLHGHEVTPKLVKPQSHQACDQVTTYLRPKNGPIAERTYEWWQRSYDWWQRSWVTARVKSVATRSMVMFKTWNLLFQIVSGRTISRATGRATLRLVVPPIVCSLTL